MNCRNCGKLLPAPRPGGRRAREFCNATCRQASHRKTRRMERRVEEIGNLAVARERIVELEQEVMHLRNRLDVERRYHQDHQPHSWKTWLKKQPGPTAFMKRVLADELMPARGSRAVYEAYVRRMGCSAEESLEFEHLWKAYLLQS